jgi:glycosyltransferase involved in cell wall biosynthesis
MNKIDPPVSVYLLTFNNDQTIRACLESVVPHADEVVVLDSGSTDQTLEICKSYNVKLYHQDWAGFKGQYQKAADLTKNLWIMFVDADELVPEDVWAEIQNSLSTNGESCNGFVIPRRNFFMGRWIKHGAWASDREIRLYRRDKGRWMGDLHAKVTVDGNVCSLKNHYLHFPYHNISEQIRTIDRYSDTASKDMFHDGKRVSAVYFFFRAILRFFKEYFLKMGFLDGTPGLYIASSSVFYVLAKYAKLWELNKVPEIEEKDEQSIQKR